MAKIDRLVFNPVAEDDVAFAVPIVAPYVALQSARYKVKLTPGRKEGRRRNTRRTCCFARRAARGRRGWRRIARRERRIRRWTNGSRRECARRRAPPANWRTSCAEAASRYPCPRGSPRRSTRRAKIQGRVRGEIDEGVCGRAGAGEARTGTPWTREAAREGERATRRLRRRGEDDESARSGENERVGEERRERARDESRGENRRGEGGVASARAMLDESSHVVCSHSSARAAPNTRKSTTRVGKYR